MQDCIFCKIATGEIECAKIWEDENFLAFLDINPNTKGMSLVIPKKHFNSYAFDMPEDEYSQLLLASRQVAKLLDKTLGVQRTCLVMEGLGVNHVHIKLYPVYGIDEKFVEMWAKERVYFSQYQGYISTQLGPQKLLEELKVLAQEINPKLYS